MLDKITAVVLTYNEVPNIGRLLERVRWAAQVVVVDSQSTDGTQSLASSFRNVRVIERAFDDHARQWHFAVHETGITTEWVIALDSDYMLGDEFVAELSELSPPAEVNGFIASFVYCVLGKRLRGSLYPPVPVLFRRSAARYEQDGHTQRVQVSGKTQALRNPILHDDRKPLSHWITSQVRYMTLEVEKLRSTAWSALRWPDRLRRLYFVAPILVPFYCLLWRGLILDGYPGLYYTLQRTAAEMILSLLLLEDRLRSTIRSPRS